MIILDWALYTLLFWFSYLGAINLYSAHKVGKLTPVAKKIATPFVYAFLVADFLANVFLATPVFLEPPEEMTVTARLQRHAVTDTWRGSVARWVSTHLVNPYDWTETHVKF